MPDPAMRWTVLHDGWEDCEIRDDGVSDMEQIGKELVMDQLVTEKEHLLTLAMIEVHGRRK
jgi:hypothetical protein